MDKELRLLLIEDVPTDAELEVRELRRAGMRVAHRIVVLRDRHKVGELPAGSSEDAVYELIAAEHA